MEQKKMIAVDFDGVLHSFVSGWQGSCTISDPPVDGAITWLIELIDCFDVVIFSSRNEDYKAVRAMKSWLIYHGLAQTGIDKLGFPIRKPACHVLIDDRCICFKGGRLPAMAELAAFTPWHGKDVW